MKKRPATPILLLAALASACGGPADSARRGQLERENEALRARVDELEQQNRLLRSQPETAAEVRERFAQDAERGTLAGLQPGSELMQARWRFGQEGQVRAWVREGRAVIQYEWRLPGGITMRVDSSGEARLHRIAALVTDPASVSIPTLAGLTLGAETHTTIGEKFGEGLSTRLLHWGAGGLYTVAQTAPLPNGRWQLEFAYQLPKGLSPAELSRIEQEVTREGSTAALAELLAERGPYLVALEEIP
ncbi:MAG: hypothetical protein ACE5HB_00690 [Terriglobia bacterium]